MQCLQVKTLNASTLSKGVREMSNLISNPAYTEIGGCDCMSYAKEPNDASNEVSESPGGDKREDVLERSRGK